GPQVAPIMLKEDVTPDELAFVEAHRDELPELETIMVHRRLYPKNGFAAHLIGYVGEVSEEMLRLPQYELNEPGDVVGKSGVEEYYNDLLQGEDGSRKILVDSHGKEVGRLGTDPAKPGKTLRLTIDLDLQIAAEQALEGKNGAMVAMDPRTGEILAMVSRPTFDANDFAVHISRQEWNQLATDENHPLMNKAIQAQLAPGSTFKIIMSVAGVQEGIAQNLKVNCTGISTFYGHPKRCWVYFEHRSHGAVDLTKAIYQSCDIFFYTLAEKLGIQRMAKWGHAFGIGEKTGVDLPSEASGVMPSEEWKIKNFKQKWFAGETVDVGIGQGSLALTPIQLARAIGAITSQGKLVRPHVAFPEDLPDTPYYKEAGARYKSVTNIPIDPAGWDLITSAMVRVLTPEGTAFSAHLDGIDFGGKTGSAQVVTIEHAKQNAEKYKQNSWFVGVTPHRNPEIVVACLFEGGEHGRLAARMVAQVIRTFVEKQRKIRGNSFAAVDKNGNPLQVSGIWSDGLRDDHHSDKLDYGTLLFPADQLKTQQVKGTPTFLLQQPSANQSAAGGRP
ncbi:MAG TPA: penicillin-binding protein 2, partial [Terriglobales bacterium]